MFMALMEIEKDKNLIQINLKITELQNSIKSDDANAASERMIELSHLIEKRKALRKELYLLYEEKRNKERMR